MIARFYLAAGLIAASAFGQYRPVPDRDQNWWKNAVIYEIYPRSFADANGDGIGDLVLNHRSDQHSWFQQSRTSTANPKADWYMWHDPQPDGSAPNNWESVFGHSAWLV